MKPAFHTDATIFGYVGADLFAGPIKRVCGELVNCRLKAIIWTVLFP